MKKLIVPLLSFFIILLLPLSAVIFSGGDLSVYLSFPPVAGYVEHRPFSRIAFTVTAGVIVVTVLPPVMHIILSSAARNVAVERFKFPFWGYAGICTALLMADRLDKAPLMQDIQRLTFLPLWISYIVVINAICIRRSADHC
jgi:hypothetical protein